MKKQPGPNTVNSSVRKYLTEREVERLMTAARKGSRWGHRDATMILVAYRHGLRACELCDLEWHQVGARRGPPARPPSEERHAFGPSYPG
jgi:integrase